MPLSAGTTLHVLENQNLEANLKIDGKRENRICRAVKGNGICSWIIGVKGVMVAFLLFVS